MSALAGIAGLICGVAIGFLLKKRGYEASKEVRLSGAIGILPVLLGVALLAALIFGLKTGEGGALFISAKGPGAQHATVGISLAAGIIVGAVMHRSKFCSVGAIGFVFALYVGIFQRRSV